MLGILIFIEPNAYGEPLHNFHVVPGRIFRRKQTEKRASGTRKILHHTFVVASERVDPDGNWLPCSHSSELRFLEIGRDPDVVQRNDHKETLSWLHALAEFHRFSSNHAADRRVDFRVAEIELCGEQIGASLL